MRGVESPTVLPCITVGLREHSTAAALNPMSTVQGEPRAEALILAAPDPLISIGERNATP